MEHDDKASVVAALTGGGVLTGNVIAHNMSLNNMQDRANKHKLSKDEFIKSLQPGDVLVQGFGRKKSSNLALPGILGKIKTTDAVKSFHGYPELHASIYAGRNRIIHAQGHGGHVETQHINDFIRGTNSKIIRHASTQKEKQNAVDFAKKQIGKKYTEHVGGNVLKELMGVGVKPGKKCNSFVCTSLPAEAYKNHTKSSYEHPYEAVKRGKAEIVGSYNGIKKLKASESLSTRLIHPSVSGLKYAVPAAIVGGTAYHLLKQKST